MNDEISLQELLNFLQKGLIWVLPVAIICTMTVYIFSFFQPKQYRAESLVLVSGQQRSTSFNSIMVSPPLLDLSAYSAALESDSVLGTALSIVSAVEDLDRFRDRLEVRSENGRYTSLLRIRVHDDNPQEAAMFADALARALIAWDRSRASSYIQNVISSIEQQLVILDEEIAQLNTMSEQITADQVETRQVLRRGQQEQLFYAQALFSSVIPTLTLLRTAEAPLEAFAPTPLRNAALAMVLALFVSYSVLFVRHALDNRLHSPEDISRLTQLPILGIFSQDDGETLTTKEISYLRTNFLHELGEGPQTILITSAISGEGKSTVTRGLSESLAQYGKQALMVDADLRQPKLADAYNVVHSVKGENVDLESQLKGYRHKVMRLNFTGSTLDFIPGLKALGEEAIGLLNQGMERCLEQWQQNYELTLIDSAPILPVADTLIIAPHCSGTLLVVNLQKTHKQQLHAVMDILQRMGVHILGVVVTHASKTK